MVLSTPRPAHSSIPSTIVVGGQPLSLARRPADYATEWGFVLQHARTIERYAWKLSGDSRVGFDDIRQEAIVWIIRNLGSYDPSRSAPTSWIYFMVRRARQELLSSVNRRGARELQVDAADLRASDSWASASRTERAVLIRQVYERLSPADARILTDYACSSADHLPDSRAPAHKSRERVARLAAFI